MRRRSRSLASNPEHEYPAEPDPAGWYRCARCGKPTRDPAADTSWCSGLQQRPLNSGGGARTDNPEIYGPYHEWIRGLRCLLTGRADHRCAGRTEGHHVRSVGAGGTDWANEVPLCARAHREIHRVGRSTFEERYELNLRARAQRLAERAPPAARPPSREGDHSVEPKTIQEREGP